MTNKQHTHYSSSLDKKKFSIVLLCHKMVSPSNIGSIFRIADAMGCEQVVFSELDQETILTPRAKKTARSCYHYVDYKSVDSTVEYIQELKSNNYQILGLEITTQSQHIREYQPNTNAKIALVIGSENTGLSDQIIAQTSKCLHIPMFGNNSSMNVATAIAIALYEITQKIISK